MDSQNPDPSEPRSSPGELSSKLGIITLICFVLPVLYALSIGPFFWAIAHEYISYERFVYFMDTFYLPLDRLAENWEPLERLLTLYIGLWVDVQ